MGRMKVTSPQSSSKKRRPAMDPDEREKQMISYAEDLAEKQLKEGTASSQVITHYLKLGTAKARLELEMMEENKKLLTAKTESIQSQKEYAEIAAKAMAAMKKYSGHGGDEEFDEDPYIF